MQSTVSPPSRRAGFNLMGIALVLTIGSLLMVSVLPGNDASSGFNEKATSNIKRLDKVEQAMQAFMAKNSRLPCPADGQYDVSVHNFGIEAASPGVCTGGTPAAPMGPDTSTTNCAGSGCVVAGVIPTKTLGLDDSYAFDEWGHHYSYYVDVRATSSGSCTTLTQSGIVIETTTTAGAVIANVMHAFVSYGKSGFGAFPMQGSTVPNRINSGSQDHDGWTNAGVNGSFTYNTTNFTNKLVRKEPTATFDDIVYYAEYIKSNCTVGSGSSSGGGTNCTLLASQGGGTLNNGSTTPAYSTSSVVYPAACPASNILTCTNGTLSCSVMPVNPNCYYQCTVSCTLPWGGTLGSGNTVAAYSQASDPTSCAADTNTLSCTNGTLSCSVGGTGGVAANCGYSACSPSTLAACVLPWGGAIFTGDHTTSYATATVPFGSTCTADTDTCTNGVLSNGDLYGACSVLAAGNCTLPWGGSIASGTGANSYSEASDPVACPAPVFRTCTNGVLSAGGNYENCSVAVGGGGSAILVADVNNNRVQKFNSSGVYQSQFGCCGNGQLHNPQGIAIDGSGNTWVVDATNNRVQEFNRSGVYVSQFGTLGTGNGQLHNPQGIAIDGSGNIWVADATNNRMQEFNSSGVYVSQFGSYGSGNGQFAYPYGIAIDGSGNIWVADTTNNRVQKFNSSGVYVSQFGTYGTGNGQLYYPYGIAINGSGNIWVVDHFNNRVQEFNSSGVYVSQFGTSGSGNGQFSYPYGIAIDGSGNIWVADATNNRVQEFNSSGVYVSKFGSGGYGNGQFISPQGIAIGGSGNIWVADNNNDRVQEFNSSGVYVSQFGCCGNGQLHNPQGIAIDGGGNTWVADAANSRVQEFNSSGVYVSQFGSYGAGNGQLHNPQGIAIDGGGNIWVADINNNRVQEFNSSGVYVSQFGSYGSGNGQLYNPYDIAIDSSGNLWVADYGNNRVQEFNSSGVYVSQFGSAGSGNGQFSYPYGIAIDSSGNLWVADYGNNRVQEFNSSGVYVSQFGSYGSGNGQFAYPYGIAIDGSGNIWVADTGNNRVQEFNSSGVYQSQVGSAGSGNGQFSNPNGIAVRSATTSCILPWGGALTTGNSATSYQFATVAYGSTCVAHTDTCTNGSLSNGDQYGACTVLPAGSCTQPWGGGLASGGTSPAYSTGAVASPSTCPAANTLSCTNGTLSCSTGSVAANCEYEACKAIVGACALPWGGFIEDSQTVTAYQTATESWNAGGTCVNSQVRTCNVGTLSGSYTNQSCSLNAAATCSPLPWGSGSLNGASPGNTVNAYIEAIGSPCPAANTLTCTNGTLSCSQGAGTTDCAYANCTTPRLSGFRGDGATAGDRTGWTAAIGDVNGDGINDLIISASYASYTASQSGSVYVVFGTASGFPDPLPLSSLNGTNLCLG
jgi:DNA-binding beta-propeller fold protein YncE